MQVELQIQKFDAPVIQTNFDAVKAELQKNLMVYEGIVVNEDNLSDAKAMQKELARLRTQLETFRKDKKKEAEKPIKFFESQCKELLEIIVKTEKPIKDGIQVFDDRKREAKRQFALEEIERVIAELGLEPKFAQDLTVIDKYMNLTASERSVREDIEIRGAALAEKQERHRERLKAVQAFIDGENERLQTPMVIDDFRYLLASDAPVEALMLEIRNRAKRLYEAEQAATAKATETSPANPPEEKAEISTAPVEEKEPEKEPDMKLYTAVIKFTGPVDKLRAISKLAKDLHVTYEVISQMEA